MWCLTLTDCIFVLFQWMKDMWRSDPCYASYGVDGSTCSFFIYLSEVSNSFVHLRGTLDASIVFGNYLQAISQNKSCFSLENS